MLQRRHLRIEIELPVKFRVEGDPSRRTYEGVTKNISRGGSCITIRKEWEDLLDHFRNAMPKVMVEICLSEDGTPAGPEEKTDWIPSRVGWFLTPGEEETPVLIGASFEQIEKVNAVLDENSPAFIAYPEPVLGR